MRALGHILVPLDFSDCSLAALDSAAELAASHDAELEVLHVVPPAASGARFSSPSAARQTLHEFSRTRAGMQMEICLAMLEEQGLTRVRARLAAGDIGETIVQVAQGECDLVVMGTHGRSAAPHMLLGSVAEQVMRKAPCPVVTVLPPSTGAEAEIVARDDEPYADSVTSDYGG